MEVFVLINSHYFVNSYNIHSKIYLVHLCVVPSLRDEKYDLIMMWWSSKPQSYIDCPYTLPLIGMYFYLASPYTLVPVVATIRGHLPNRASPISFPAFPTTEESNFPNRSYNVSVPSFRIPLLKHHLPMDPTA